MAVVADGCSELGCGDPSMSLAWTAGFVLLKGAGLPLKILLLSAERWLPGCGQRHWSKTFLFILLKDANNNQVGTIFDHSQNPSGF